MWQWISFLGELFYVKIFHCEGNILLVVPDIQETDQKTLKRQFLYCSHITLLSCVSCIPYIPLLPLKLTFVGMESARE